MEKVMMKCPVCKGAGENDIFNPCSRIYRHEMMKCEFCGGGGEISKEDGERLEDVIEMFNNIDAFKDDWLNG